MTLSQYLLTVSSTIWIHLMVMFKRNQAQLLEFVRWHMDGFRTQSLVSFVSTIALWCEFSWKMPLKKKSPGKLTTMSPVSLGGTCFPSHITQLCFFLPLPPCPLQVCLFCFWDVPWINLDHTHVGMWCCGAGWCCSPGTIRSACWIQLYGWFHHMIVTKCHPLHIQGGLYYIICLISLNSIIHDFDTYIYILFWSNQTLYIGIAWYHHIIN